MEKKFWAIRLEKDVKELKKSAWNVLTLLVYKYDYKDVIQTRGMSCIDIAIQIIENDELWEQLNENEKYYVSGLLGATESEPVS